MALKIFKIEFDRSDAVYIPGDIVSGYVIIDLAREESAEALKLSAEGEATVQWRQSKITHTDHELYFSLTIPLLEKSEGDGKVHFPAGLSRYRFCMRLPHDIPSSFEHWCFGHIKYTIKAVIVRSWGFNHKCKAAFTLISTYDLNIRRTQCIGIHDEVNENFSCCYLNWFCFGTIYMHVKIPVTGFVPGQWIEVTLDLDNNSSIELRKICLKLQQSLIFRTKYDQERYDKVTVVADQKIGPFNRHVAITLRLPIPLIPPSELEFCRIIRLHYMLRLVLHSNTYCKIVKKYPILIGTIPLQPSAIPTPSAPPASALPQSLLGTSKMEYVTSEFDVCTNFTLGRASDSQHRGV